MSFVDRFGKLTVEQVLELNKAARWYCDHDVTSESGEVEGTNMRAKNDY